MRRGGKNAGKARKGNFEGGRKVFNNRGRRTHSTGTGKSEEL